MDRRIFLAGLSGAAGAITLVSVLPRAAQAAPIARALETPLPEPRPDATSAAGSAPDGTPIEQAQWGPPPHWRRPGWRRGWRGGPRMVCRRHRNRWGRWVETCRRVW